MASDMIFISYSRKDIAYAKLLHNALNENGFETWIDWQDIPPSSEWLNEVYTAIEQANTFIFIYENRKNKIPVFKNSLVKRYIITSYKVIIFLSAS